MILVRLGFTWGLIYQSIHHSYYGNCLSLFWGLTGRWSISSTMCAAQCDQRQCQFQPVCDENLNETDSEISRCASISRRALRLPPKKYCITPFLGQKIGYRYKTRYTDTAGSPDQFINSYNHLFIQKKNNKCLFIHSKILLVLKQGKMCGNVHSSDIFCQTFVNF